MLHLSQSEANKKSGKRAAADASAGPSKRNRNQQGTDGDFKSILSQSGVELDLAEDAVDDTYAVSNKGACVTEGFGCTHHPSKLKLLLDAALQHEPLVREAFLKGFAIFLGSSANLRRALLPLTGTLGSAPTATQRTSVGYSAIEESLMKVLLKVDCIQTYIIDHLLEKLPEVAAQEGDSDSSSLSQNLPRLILNQMRWLDHLVDATALTKKLLECMVALPLPLQRDLISYLPEVVEDSDHALVVQMLGERQESEPTLLVSILDAYSSLPLPSELLATITQQVLELLPSAQASSLPVLVRFLLEAANPDNMSIVVKDMREGLKLSPLATNLTFDGLEDMDESDDYNDGSKKDDMKGNSGDALTLEALRLGLYLRPDVCAAFITSMKDAKGSRNHSEADIWIIFCLHTLPEMKAKVTSLLLKKVGGGDILGPLLDDALHGRAGALTFFFPSMLELADSLVRSPDPSCRRFGTTLYVNMFRQFTEQYHRQEIVSAVLAHAGAGSSHEIDTSLATLVQLVKPIEELPTLTQTNRDMGARVVAHSPLRPFVPFIKGLLDFFMDFTDSQVRSVFSVLCAASASMSTESSNEGGGSSTGGGASSTGGNSIDGLDDVHIFIRKNVTHSSMNYKRVGIIGATAMAAHIMSMREGNEVRAMADACTTIQLVFDSCRNSCEARGFMYEELGEAVRSKKFSVELVSWLSETVSNPLQEEFLAELEEGGKLPMPAKEYCNGNVKVKLRWALDEGQEQIALNTLDLITSTDPAKKDACSYLCPLVSLCTACEHFCSDSLDEIDGILGCPLLLVSDGIVDRIHSLLPSTQEVVFNNYFYAAEWCRELINAFATVANNELRLKVVKRLHNLCEIEEALMFMLKRCTSLKLIGEVTPESASEKTKTKKKTTEDTGTGKGKGKEKEKVGQSAALTLLEERNNRARLKAVLRPLSQHAVLIFGHEDMNTIAESPVYANTRTAVDQLVLESILLHLQASLPTKQTALFGANAVGSSANKNKGKTGSKGLQAPLEGASLIRLYLKGGVFKAMHGQLKRLAIFMGCDGNGELSIDDLEEGSAMDGSLKTILKILKLLCTTPELQGTGKARLNLSAVIGEFVGGGVTEDDDPFVMIFETLESFSKNMQKMEPAVELVQVLEAVADSRVKCLGAAAHEDGLDQDDEHTYMLHVKLSDVCLALLGKDWTDGDSKFRYNARNLGVLLKTHLKWAKDKLAAVQVMISETLPLLLETDEAIGPTETFPTLSAQSFVTWCTPVFAALERAWSNTEFPMKEGAGPPIKAVLLRATKMVILYKIMVNFTKKNATLEKKPILLSMLKGSSNFITTVLKQVSWMSSIFPDNSDEVLVLLDHLQKGNRQVQALCTYGKSVRDSGLMREAPKVKRVLETFIYRIKVLAKTHNIEGALSVANLKSRNPDGSEVHIEIVPETRDEDDTEAGEEGGDEEESDGDEEEEEEESED